MTAFSDLVVYDAEIQRLIPDRDEPRDNKYQYCQGWTDWLGMGVACVVAYLCAEKQFRVYMGDNLREFGKLAQSRLMVGFNIEGFDNKLLEAHGVTIPNHWDLMPNARMALGEPREYTRGITKAGRKVDDYARVNLKLRKSGLGANAPKLWQDGKIGTLINYTLDDVYCELGLIKLCPTLIDPVTMQSFVVKVPWLP